jgi:hypothetical protein
MGIVHKVSEDIKDFILAQKKGNSAISCRGLAYLIEQRFQAKVSKSSINVLCKEAGLSMPVGRRMKKRRRLKIEAQALLENKPPLPEQIPQVSQAPLVEPPASAPAPKEEPKIIPLGLPPEEKPKEELTQPEAQAAPESEKEALRQKIKEELQALAHKEKPAEEPAKKEEPPIVAPAAKPEPPPPEPQAEKPPPEKAPPEKAPLEKPGPQEAQPEAAQIEKLQAEPIPQEVFSSGAILLKAADSLISGSISFSELIKNRLGVVDPEALAKTESLLYLPLFAPGLDAAEMELEPLWPLVNKKIPLAGLKSFCQNLEGDKTLCADLAPVAAALLQQGHCIKIDISDGESVYLDGQLHSLWSTPHIPFDFGLPIYQIKDFLNKCFWEDKPAVIFNAPGYDTPSKEFFNFLLGLGLEGKKIINLATYGHKLEVLESSGLQQNQKRFVIFGLWPWQYTGQRKVKKIGQFQPFVFEMTGAEFYLAEVEIELSQPQLQNTLTFCGCALKTSPAEKTRLVILSNLTPETASPAYLANRYLKHWPNLEEAFTDYSHKIELFTYTAGAQRFFPAENIRFEAADIRKFLADYLAALDLYVKWHFLPDGFENTDFSLMKEQFYGLKVTLRKRKDSLLAVFHPAVGYRFQKQLEYACRRINEREIIFPEGLRLWCLPQP